MPLYRKVLKPTINNYTTEEITNNITNPTVLLEKEVIQTILFPNESNLNFGFIGDGMITNINVSDPCRLRIYINLSKRNADITRQVGQPLPENHGLIYEGVFTNQNLSLPVLPVASSLLSSAAYSVDTLVECSIEFIKITSEN